jgi:hypothetical protein
VSDSAEPSAAPLPLFAPACVSIPTGTGECKRVGDAAVARLDVPGTVLYVQVQAYGCEAAGPCPPGFGARRRGDVTIELGEPAGLRRFPVLIDDAGQIQIGQGEEVPSALIDPASEQSRRLENPSSLGHCGIYSPIDVDGSLWDPIADIDGDRPEAINAAAGTILILAPRAGRFVTASGFRVDLVRRPGAKSYSLCA